MKTILKRLYLEPVYLGTVLIGIVSLGTAVLGLDAAVGASITTLVVIITGKVVRERVSPVEGTK